MYPNAFSYVRAESVEHALQELADHGQDARVLAGGCSLIPLMKYRTQTPKVLIDIGDLEDELHYVHERDDNLCIGALTRHADAQIDPAVDAQPVVREVADTIADVQVRNMGTVLGGVLAVEPTGDWIPPLLALRGTVLARSVNGQREVAADDLVVAPFQNSLRGDELATEVRFPVRAPGSGASHQKLTIRVNAGVVNCSAGVTVEDGVIATLGIGLGALERHPVRAAAAETVLTGQRPEGEVLDEAARAAIDEVEAFTDARGEAQFRKAAAAALLKRAVRGAYEQATSEVRV